MTDTFDYRARAIMQAGPGNEAIAVAVAELLHGNESLHMHQDVESKTPCAYCWLRAGKALMAIGNAGFRLVPAADLKATKEHGEELTALVARWQEQFDYHVSDAQRWSNDPAMAVAYRDVCTKASVYEQAIKDVRTLLAKIEVAR